ncbi:hypothetical protein LOTGIDRAFT_163734 [Lottia gigantea]|uniref:Uncharacterized protein n=1 Tax=Lottia gigantea TaxID=225164 RepID=V4BPS8_LOTGI|nr:hypothetical protein LOTGIDRAFT_163734 [Lottia gigantea]ESO90849.1 hypothetical protein LOTGIDRAFT_163734 [Lottia gigantea]
MDLLKAGKVRSAIPCNECEKPSCIYSQLKLSRDQEAVLQQIKEAYWFICGDGLDSDAVITRCCLTCTSPMESQYFSACSGCGLPAVCHYCGTLENLLDDYEDYKEDLYSKFSSVRPLCAPCRAKGLEAKTWGQIIKNKKENPTLNIRSRVYTIITE